MKYIKQYENKILYKVGDFVKTSKIRLANHDYIYDIVKIIDVDAFGGKKDDFAYISYIVTTISFDADILIRFHASDDRILRLATSEEIEKYKENELKVTANKFNL